MHCCRLERHQPYRLLFVLRIVRCAQCRQQWPCPTYMDARSSLLNPTPFDVTAALRPSNAGPWQR